MSATTTTEAPATEKQVAFITRLAADRDQALPIVDVAKMLISDQFLADLSRKAASAIIDELLKVRPTVAAATVADAPKVLTGLDLSNVPSGTYAVPNADTRLKVRIDNVSKGKWAGWVFVKDGAVYGNGKRYGSQKPGQAYTGAIAEHLATIAADPREAAAAYGRITGTCGLCGRPLEDETSVANGIGPVCIKKF